MRVPVTRMEQSAQFVEERHSASCGTSILDDIGAVGEPTISLLRLLANAVSAIGELRCG
jgi:hypothetical protein